jgi:CubicO group peptidase (beta-lactamase class C family)
MKNWVKWSLAGTGVGLVLVVTAAGWFMQKVGPIGSGFVSKYLCSSTFISQRDPDVVFREDVVPVNPLAPFFDYSIDYKKKTVTADAHGLFGLTAIYREGCGCSLVIGTTEAAMRAQDFLPADTPAKPSARQTDIPWPAGSGGPADAAAIGIDVQKLEAALDDAFREPRPDNPRKTRAVVVVYDGQLVAERYGKGIHKEMPMLGWSMAKSITNALVGILVRDGRLDIQKPAPVPEWQAANDPRRAITLDQLLRMSSGLAFEEVYKPLYDATDMLYGSYDFAAFAAEKPLAAPPDSTWSYSSGTANIVARIVRQTVEKETPHYYQFIRGRFFDKIGMLSAVIEPDSSGTFVGSSYSYATPRDWARFGLLYLNDGVWQGERVLPEGWVAYTATPTPKAPKGEYGAHFWLNAGAPGDPGNRLWPNAPRDAYAAQGFQEQKVIIIPSRKAVLVRFGATSDRTAWDTDAFITNVLAALPG